MEPPSTVDDEKLVIKKGPYVPLTSLSLSNAFPVVQGYKNSVGIGYHANINDPLGFAKRPALLDPALVRHGFIRRVRGRGPGIQTLRVRMDGLAQDHVAVGELVTRRQSIRTPDLDCRDRHPTVGRLPPVRSGGTPARGELSRRAVVLRQLEAREAAHRGCRRRLRDSRSGASYFVNGFAIGALQMDLTTFIRYVSPVTEELLKGLVIIVLVRAHRIGFLVDAAIFGFAVGTGFAVIENLFYLRLVPDAGVGTWIVRGFGTAIMHGGSTAILAVLGLALQERTQRAELLAFIPGFGLAVLLHSAFNHLFLSPKLSTLAILIVLPPLFLAVFQRSEKAVGDWLGKGFDADTEMLNLINSGHFSDSPVGQYLHKLKASLKGPVVADVLCYLRLYTELALRAKGILMMRENGFDVPIDEATREKFAEMRYPEGSIGKTGLLAIQPMLHMSQKDLWQLYMLGK